MDFNLPILSSASGVPGALFSPVYHVTRRASTPLIIDHGLHPGGKSHGVLPSSEESWFAPFYRGVRPIFVALTPARATHFEWRQLTDEAVELETLEVDVRGFRLLPDIPTLHLPPLGDGDPTPRAVIVETGILWQGPHDFSDFGSSELTPDGLRPFMDECGIITYERLFNDPHSAEAVIRLTETAAVLDALPSERVCVFA